MAEGATHISCHHTRIRSRETGENRKTNEQQSLGLPRAEKRYCNTICMCRLSLAWVTSENSTMLLGSDILRLFFTGPYLVSSPLCSVSGVDCPSVDPRQLPLLLSNYQLCLLGRVVNSRSRVPLPLPDTARFHVQESFVWFRAKTDSSALAACPHSATWVWLARLVHSCVLSKTFCSKSVKNGIIIIF